LTYTTDRYGITANAGYFDGIDDYIRIPSHPSLNLQQAITLNFWMQIDGAITEEAYVLSHGSWENRWKISMLTEGLLRWTIKTDKGVVDLDSKTVLKADTLYNVCVTYNGAKAEIYINGKLNSAENWTGLMATTAFDLTIAQHMPGDNQYNYCGILDDIRIYNRALDAGEIMALYDISSGIHGNGVGKKPTETRLLPAYPNPFNAGTTIQYDLHKNSQVSIIVYNMRGQIVGTLVNAQQTAGTKTVFWNGCDAAGIPAASGIYIIVLHAGNIMERQKMLLLR